MVGEDFRWDAMSRENGDEFFRNCWCIGRFERNSLRTSCAVITQDPDVLVALVAACKWANHAHGYPFEQSADYW